MKKFRKLLDNAKKSVRLVAKYAVIILVSMAGITNAKLLDG